MSNVSREDPLVRVLLAAAALVVGAALGAGGLLIGFLLTLVAAAVLVAGAGVEISPALSLVLGLVFVQGIGCAGVALTYYKLRPVAAPKIQSILNIAGSDRPFGIGAAVPDLGDAVTVVVSYALALGGAIGGSILIQAAQSISGTELDTGSNAAAEIGMENPEILLLLIPASILLIGPGEELLFRGVVQGRIREVFSPVPGVLIPSVIFAGLHWFALSGGSPEGNLVALALLIVPSLVFGSAYEYSGNIVVPSLVHGLYNATLFSLLYLVVAFGDELPQQALLGLAS
jgi:membrane protease YdiL (CAAX protease family)